MGFFKRNQRKRNVNDKVSSIDKGPVKEPKVKQESHFEPHLSFKVLLIGHDNSGHISSLESFGNSWFKSNTKLTIGISFEVKEIRLRVLILNYKYGT